jgi:hypothetical protein
MSGFLAKNNTRFLWQVLSEEMFQSSIISLIESCLCKLHKSNSLADPSGSCKVNNRGVQIKGRCRSFVIKGERL